MAKRKYKKGRAKARSAWETYNSWYDKYTKGTKKNLFTPRYSKEEFDKMYKDIQNYNKSARKTGIPTIKNPAKAVVQSQSYFDRDFINKWNRSHDRGSKLQDMEDLSNREARRMLAEDWVRAQGFDPNASDNEGWRQFREYFY